MEFEKMTHRHAVKLTPAVHCSVDVIGHGSVKSASRMIEAIVIFVDNTTKVSELVKKGVVI